MNVGGPVNRVINIPQQNNNEESKVLMILDDTCYVRFGTVGGPERFGTVGGPEINN